MPLAARRAAAPTSRPISIWRSYRTVSAERLAGTAKPIVA